MPFKLRCEVDFVGSSYQSLTKTIIFGKRLSLKRYSFRQKFIL
jgi:hypothetical protein